MPYNVSKKFTRDTGNGCREMNNVMARTDQLAESVRDIDRDIHCVTKE